MIRKKLFRISSSIIYLKIIEIGKEILFFYNFTKLYECIIKIYHSVYLLFDIVSI